MSTDEASPRTRQSSTGLRIALGVLALVILLYSVLIVTRPLLGVAVVVWLVGLALLWKFFLLSSRFVRAVERIADAMDESTSEMDETDVGMDETDGGMDETDGGTDRSSSRRESRSK